MNNDFSESLATMLNIEQVMKQLDNAEIMRTLAVAITRHTGGDLVARCADLLARKMVLPGMTPELLAARFTKIAGMEGPAGITEDGAFCVVTVFAPIELGPDAVLREVPMTATLKAAFLAKFGNSIPTQNAPAPAPGSIN